VPGALAMMARSVSTSPQVECSVLCDCVLVNLAPAFDGFLPRSTPQLLISSAADRRGWSKTHNLEPTKMQPSGVRAAAACSTPIAAAVAPN
jgi:hypothetical protein